MAMGSKNKQKRFKENETFKNVIQPAREIMEKDAFGLKGQWQAKYFKNDHPIVWSLAVEKVITFIWQNKIQTLIILV